VNCEDSLILEGENVLQREIRGLMVDPHKGFVKYEILASKSEEDINLSHWDTRELGR